MEQPEDSGVLQQQQQHFMASDSPLGQVLKRHLISILWSGTFREKPSGYVNMEQIYVRQGPRPHQLCELSTDAAVKKKELSSSPGVNSRC